MKALVTALVAVAVAGTGAYFFMSGDQQAATPIQSVAASDPIDAMHADLDTGKAVLVDVREWDEWQQQHIDGAVLLPLSWIQQYKNDEQIESVTRDKIVYLYCRSGRRAKVAEQKLDSMGFDARAVGDGIASLLTKGFKAAR